MAFWIGFFCGIVFTLVMTPMLIKWYIGKKMRDLTGGLFQ